MGPIVDIDDVRSTLGAWLLERESMTAAEMRKLWTSARELAQLVELNLRLRDVTEAGFAVNYFSPDRRREIRAILDEMDAVSDGTHTTLRRRNETLGTQSQTQATVS